MKRALVTGASEGIGRSFARKLAAQGYALTVVARNEERLSELVRELGGSPHQPIVADLSTAEGIDRIGSELADGKYNLLVNNAGFATYEPFHESDPARMRETMRVNCEAVLVLSRAFLGKAVAGDALINVSSTASLLPMPIASVYTATKAFVTGLSQSLWYEQRSRGVYVMALCPGSTSTRFNARAGGTDTKALKLMSQTPDQVVDVALAALKRRRRPVVVSGPQKYAILGARLASRRMVTLLAGKILETGGRALGIIPSFSGKT